MKQSVRVSKAPLNIHLGAYVLDTISLFLMTFILYLTTLYGVFATSFNYLGNENQMREIEDRYNLNLDANQDYTKYEAVIQNFYFEEFSDELETYYNDYYQTNYTIIHIYNCNVLRLVSEPNYQEYKTDYYQYVQNEDGSFDVDSLAIKLEGSGKVYEQNMHDLFYNSYTDLKDYLKIFNDDYLTLSITNENYRLLSRIIGFSLSFITLFTIIPLCNKNNETLFQRFFKVTYVNRKNGYLPAKYKIIIRPFILFIIPFIGVCLGTDSSLIILSIGFIFINFLLILLSKNNKDLADRMLSIYPASNEESLIFKNTKDEEDFFNSPEGKKILEPDLLEKLNNIKDISIIETPDNKKI